MTQGFESDEPIDDHVPVPDAVEQRRPVTETPDLSEEFQPTEVSQLIDAPAPVDANPSDWMEQNISADIGVEDDEPDI